jgi:hypothetical protein
MVDRGEPALPIECSVGNVPSKKSAPSQLATKNMLGTVDELWIHRISQRMLRIEETPIGQSLTPAGWEYNILSGGHLGVPTKFVQIQVLAFIFHDCRLAERCSRTSNLAHLLLLRCWDILLPSPSLELILVLWLTITLT